MTIETIIENRMNLFNTDREQGGCNLDITVDGDEIREDGDLVEGTVLHSADTDTDVWVIEVDGWFFVGCNDVGATRVA